MFGVRVKRVKEHTLSSSFPCHYSLVGNFRTMADGGSGKSKEITAKLKEAKEAISKKEYKEAAKYCRVSEKY